MIGRYSILKPRALARVLRFYLGVILALVAVGGCGRGGKDAATAAPPLSPAAVCLTQAQDAAKQAEKALAASKPDEALALFLQARDKLTEGRKLARPNELQEFGDLSGKIEPQIASLEYRKQREEERQQALKEAAASTPTELVIGPVTDPATVERQRKAEEEAKQKQLAAQVDSLTKFGAAKDSTVKDDTDVDPAKVGERPKPTPPPPPPPRKRKR